MWLPVINSILAAIGYGFDCSKEYGAYLGFMATGYWKMGINI